MTSFQNDGSAASWYSSAEDFGQKVDLSVSDGLSLFGFALLKNDMIFLNY